MRALVREEPSFDDLIRRRHRKRRNQRIAAGVVGIAVFVAAVWIVTSGRSFDRSETSVVPGGDADRRDRTGRDRTAERRRPRPRDRLPSGPQDRREDAAARKHRRY